MEALKPMKLQLISSTGNRNLSNAPLIQNFDSVVEGEVEPHHEKRWVLKKVKDKAKKIKEILTKHGHGHSHGEEEDKEMVDDPEDHGAPMSESAAVWSGVGGQEVDSGMRKGNLERPSVTADLPGYGVFYVRMRHIQQRVRELLNVNVINFVTVIINIPHIIGVLQC